MKSLDALSDAENEVSALEIGMTSPRRFLEMLREMIHGANAASRPADHPEAVCTGQHLAGLDFFLPRVSPSLSSESIRW